MERSLKIFELPLVNDWLYYASNSLINELSKESKIFVEPFCVNTSMFLNLNHKFDKVVVNDQSKDIWMILKSFRDNPYTTSMNNKISEEDYTCVKKILLDSILYSENFEKIIDIYDDENVLFFINPSYIINNKIFDYDSLINNFANIKGNIMFVDVYTEEILKKLIDITGKKWYRRTNNLTEFKETIYYNF